MKKVLLKIPTKYRGGCCHQDENVEQVHEKRKLLTQVSGGEKKLKRRESF